MSEFCGHLPRRYVVDKRGERVLIGLSIEETFEFETLDNLPAIDAGGDVAWDDNGVPTSPREKRWLELYTKHDAAWRRWMAENNSGASYRELDSFD